MANPNNVPFGTGVEVIDSLKALQLTMDLYGNGGRDKVERVVESVRSLDISKWLGNEFMVSSKLALAKRPDKGPKERVLFSSGLLFIGTLDAYGYMQDDTIPLDSLMLTFEEPDVVGVSPEHVDAMRFLSLEVPVLAIDSCISTSNA